MLIFSWQIYVNNVDNMGKRDFFMGGKYTL